MHEHSDGEKFVTNYSVFEAMTLSKFMMLYTQQNFPKFTKGIKSHIRKSTVQVREYTNQHISSYGFPGSRFTQSNTDLFAA